MTTHARQMCIHESAIVAGPFRSGLSGCSEAAMAAGHAARRTHPNNGKEAKETSTEKLGPPKRRQVRLGRQGLRARKELTDRSGRPYRHV